MVAFVAGQAAQRGGRKKKGGVGKNAGGESDRRLRVRSSIPNSRKSPFSAMASTEEVQEKSPRGIPKAPFIVSFASGRPLRAIDRERRSSPVRFVINDSRTSRNTSADRTVMSRAR
jgi:hypothetical protein